MVPTLYLYDRWEGRRGILPTLGSMTHTEELGGEDTVELDCLLAPEKGDRILWRDPEDGRWREQEVVRTDEATGGACHVYAESSLCELLRDYVEEEQLVAKTAVQAMGVVLGHTAVGARGCWRGRRQEGRAALPHERPGGAAARRGRVGRGAGDLRGSY